MSTGDSSPITDPPSMSDDDDETVHADNDRMQEGGVVVG